MYKNLGIIIYIILIINSYLYNSQDLIEEDPLDVYECGTNNINTCNDLNNFADMTDFTCAKVGNTWGSLFQCAVDINCPILGGAYVGNCFVANLYEYIPEAGLDCASASDLVNCEIDTSNLNDTQAEKFTFSSKCTNAEHSQCDAYLGDFQCDNFKMQAYLDCYWDCAENDYTRSFYAGKYIYLITMIILYNIKTIILYIKKIL